MSLCQTYNNIYYNLCMGTQMLPLFATLGGILAKVTTVIGQIIPEDMGPDLGIGACWELACGGGGATAKGDALTELGLVLGTAEGGDAAAEVMNKSGEVKEGRRSRREEWRETKHEKWRTSMKEYAEQTSMLHRTKAYRGEPFTKHDRRRHFFLLPIQVVEQALVMRHYPVGKGFLIRVSRDHVGRRSRTHDASFILTSPHANGADPLASVLRRVQNMEVDGIDSPASRPLYLFVKCWSLQHRDGLVLTTYDARDVGFVIDKVRPRRRSVEG